jgi:hypothetical protein
MIVFPLLGVKKSKGILLEHCPKTRDEIENTQGAALKPAKGNYPFEPD